MTVSILIATYGEEAWSELAWSRAYPSTLEQGAHEVLVGHEPEGTIASARNHLAEKATGEFLLFCDADDELAPGYIEAMTEAIEARSKHERELGPTLFTPRVQYVNHGRREKPKFWPEKDLRHSNWLVIGTLVPRGLFLELCGFDDAEHAYEDWSLFARCWKAGAQIVKVPDAIYVAHVIGGSRNRRMSSRERVEIHYAIGRRLFPEVYDEGWLRQHLRNAGVRAA